jgi:type IV secretion system protein VirB10
MAVAAPARPGTYRSGRQVILLILIIVAVLAILIGGAIWALRPAAPEPKRADFHSSKGEEYSPPPVKVVARPPQSRQTNEALKDNFRQGGTRNNGLVPDPALVAPISAPNQGKGQTFIKERTAEQLARAKAEEGEEGEDNPLSRSLKRSNLGPKSVARVDPDYLYKIYPGATIPCNKARYSNSQLMGFVTCEVPVDIYNSAKTTKLIPRFSQVFGEYKTSVIYGNDRIPVLWTEIRTSDIPPVIVPINSPAADMLGGAGMTGVVDNHFWSTLFATGIYTLIQAGPALAQAAIANNSQSQTQIQFNQLTGPGQHLGSRILEREMNRPPTLESNPGESLMISVGSEIDFSHAIELRMVRGGR